jgi:hypothetical protein
VTTQATGYAVFADLFLCVESQLLFHRTQLLILHINEDTFFEVGIGKVPGILYA